MGDRAVPRPHGKGGVVMGRSPPSLGLSPMLGGCFREARVTCPRGAAYSVWRPRRSLPGLRPPRGWGSGPLGP